MCVRIWRTIAPMLKSGVVCSQSLNCAALLRGFVAIREAYDRKSACRASACPRTPTYSISIDPFPQSDGDTFPQSQLASMMDMDISEDHYQYFETSSFNSTLYSDLTYPLYNSASAVAVPNPIPHSNLGAMIQVRVLLFPTLCPFFFLSRARKETPTNVQSPYVTCE